MRERQAIVLFNVATWLGPAGIVFNRERSSAGIARSLKLSRLCSGYTVYELSHMSRKPHLPSPVAGTDRSLADARVCAHHVASDLLAPLDNNSLSTYGQPFRQLCPPLTLGVRCVPA